MYVKKFELFQQHAWMVLVRAIMLVVVADGDILRQH